MIDRQPRLFRAGHESLALRVVETEPHILYRADAAVVALPGGENARQSLIADLKVSHLACVRAVKLRDLVPDARRIGQFDQHRRRALLLARKELIVSVNLMVNGACT